MTSSVTQKIEQYTTQTPGLPQDDPVSENYPKSLRKSYNQQIKSSDYPEEQWFMNDK
jgi:hypothetical protein